MKKINDLLVFITGILFFILSYEYDNSIGILFKTARMPFLDLIFKIITNFGFVVAIILILPSILLYKKNKRAIYFLAIAFLASITAAFIIKLIVLRQRPIEAFTYPLINIINYSFPSMHAMVVFALLPLLMAYFPKQKYSWVSFAFLVSFTRIYFGFHFLSDVVFGALAGYFIGDLLTEKFNFQRKLNFSQK